MPASRKRLGNLAPAAATETDLYNSPATVTDVVVSALIVANRSASNATFRVSLSPEASSTATSDYLAYDLTIQARSVVELLRGVVIPPDYDLRVYASSADLTFQLFGQENS